MFGYVLRRMLISVVVLFAASLLSFVMVSSLGDPLAGYKARQPAPSAEQVALKRHQLKLDRPILWRYGQWLGKFVRGDMGDTLQGQSVSGQLGAAFWVTMRMSLASVLLSIVLALVTGVYSAVRQYSFSDYVSTFASFVFLSMPVFWLALLLKRTSITWINHPNFFGWHPWNATIVYTSGESSPVLEHSFWARMGDYGGHLLLPTIALALVTYASWSRYQRAEMLDVLSSDYVRLARAKGVEPSRVLTRHALRNALIPFVTVVAIDVGSVIAGAVITEIVFGWHGMGIELITAITQYDPNLLLAWLMITGIFVIAFNLLADVLYGVLDPRSRTT